MFLQNPCQLCIFFNKLVNFEYVIFSTNERFYLLNLFKIIKLLNIEGNIDGNPYLFFFKIYQ